jgi:hypothetical protein
MSRIIKRQSQREIVAANQGQLSALAMMAGKPPPEFSVKFAPKQERAAKPRPTGVSEADVNSEIRRVAQQRKDVALWRNTRGQVMLESGGRITYGVGPNGASDWIGYRAVVVTPDMVGTTVAVFVAIEAKRPGEDMRDDQREFVAEIIANGGIAGVAHSAAEAAEILDW